MTTVQHRCSDNESTSCCHTGAITARGDHVHCCTFVEIAIRAGADRAGLAGTCHRSDCRIDDMLECPASSVEVGARADGPTTCPTG
jgi:hypothetical protein